MPVPLIPWKFGEVVREIGSLTISKLSKLSKTCHVLMPKHKMTRRVFADGVHCSLCGTQVDCYSLILARTGRCNEPDFVTFNFGARSDTVTSWSLRPALFPVSVSRYLSQHVVLDNHNSQLKYPAISALQLLSVLGLVVCKRINEGSFKKCTGV